MSIPPLFTIVTGASENHSKSLIQFIKSVYSNFNIPFELFIYDLGLEINTFEKIKNLFPKANYFTFKFEDYPSYFNIKIDAGQYAWKIPIIKEVSEKTQGKYLLWLDAGCVIPETFNPDELIEVLDKNGIYSPWSDGNIKKWTFPSVITLFNLNKEFILKENRAGGLQFYNITFPKVKEFIENYYNLVLKKEYIAPEGSNRSNHRQDQALFTILYYLYIQENNLEHKNISYNILTHKDCD